jgi:hypothetical protein
MLEIEQVFRVINKQLQNQRADKCDTSSIVAIITHELIT